MAGILSDPFVEAVARALCREAGHDPDDFAPIAGAEAIIGGLRQPVEMTGPRWMAYGVEASDRLDGVQRRNAARFVQEAGRG